MDKKKILFVDDVALFLELEKTFFRRDQFDLLVAKNGEEALAIVTRQKPDLVFLDLYMPGMNGDECCRRIKSNDAYKHIPVVMVTQAGSDEDLELCHSAGCDDIVLKPINRHQITATAQKFLEVKERQEPRCGARLRIHYGTPEHTLTDYSINLSTGGLFLETSNILPEDTLLRVEFMVPGHDAPLRCTARVAWTNDPDARKKLSLPPGMGLQFLDLTMDEMDAVRGYLRKDCLNPFW